MKVFNWDSWEECEKYFTEILPPSNPPWLPQGRSYYIGELYSFFLHWKEHKRLAHDFLAEIDVWVTNPYELQANFELVLKEFWVSDFYQNLNTFLVQYHYAIYL